MYIFTYKYIWTGRQIIWKYARLCVSWAKNVFLCSEAMQPLLLRMHKKPLLQAKDVPIVRRSRSDSEFILGRMQSEDMRPSQTLTSDALDKVALHDQHLCKPCSFFRRKRCNLGDAYNYCHLSHGKFIQPGKRLRQRNRNRANDLTPQHTSPRVQEPLSCTV